MRASRLLVPLGVAALSACSGTPAGSGLQVQVVLEAGTTSRCVKVVADDGSRRRESGPIAVEGRSLLRVAVLQDDFSQPVQLEAVGYADEGCATLTSPPERSEREPGYFTAPVSTVTLTLRRPAGTDAGTDAGLDRDNDGYQPPADCDDLDPLINPDAGEVCRGGVDDDCDTLIDCADPQCLNQACGTNGTCLANGTCQAPLETGLCGDGVDNDSDGLTDCADPDCPAGTTCSDLNACTTGDVCGGDAGCVSGSTLACVTPPAQCFDGMGACLPDAGTCSYAVRTGSCDDGLACTTVDTCLADGGCTGAPVPCTTPPGQCFAASGTCQEPDAGCAYAPLPTGACSDGDNCTVSDTCDGDGGCVGTPVTCTSPDQCLATTGTCDPDGGCLFAPRTGIACDAGTGAGTCSDAGACVIAPPPVFPYTPSNFTEAQLPPLATAMTFGCGLTQLYTQTSDGGIAWTNNCAGNPTPAYALVPVGSSTAVLLYLDALTISGTLQASGGRPLILAVKGSASISGTLDVGSTEGRTGAGANLNCGSAAGGNGAATTGNQNGGGGGGAFGANGAAGAPGGGGTGAGTAGVAITGLNGLVPLRGGCPGGNGGRPESPLGVRGRGGGAVQLSVAGALTIGSSGRVTAYGEGGQGGDETATSRVGGGGGGSGGGILVEAATITVGSGGAVTANGGAGGEAGGGNPGGDGNDGQPASTAQALPTTTGTCGGNGGLGGSQDGAAQAGFAASGCSGGSSGGGGGGGVGVVVLKASTSCTLTGGIFSPAAKGNGVNGCPAP
jgi:hypothetical protein